MVYKNTAGQYLIVYAHNVAGDVPETGDAANITAQISKDTGASAATNDVNPTELDAVDQPGVYAFLLTQAETNCDLIALSAVSTTLDVVIDVERHYTNEGNAIKVSTDYIEKRFPRNAAYNNYTFVMVSNNDGYSRMTNIDVIAQRSLDGGPFLACSNAPTEIGATGVYSIDFGATDLNAAVVTLRFTGAGCRPLEMTYETVA